MRKLSSVIWLLAPLAPLAPISWLAWSYTPVENVQSQGDIIFSHQLHVIENEMDCVDCHEDIETSTAAEDLNYPTMDLCADCHDQVEEEDECGMCHLSGDDPVGLAVVTRDILFNHESHISRGTDCLLCHGDLDSRNVPVDMRIPEMATCLTCHDGASAENQCEKCHENKITLADIHPAEWLKQHRDEASLSSANCQSCHRNEASCLKCHFGDNLSGQIHDLNYMFTHALDAQSKQKDCQTCHNTASFCNDCHTQENRLPLNHSSPFWILQHGKEAVRDVENCASCHDSGDPTCAQSGCHSDFDGVLGTNPRLHVFANDLRYHGQWHEDNGSFCYQCHTNTTRAGQGFCGYCHGANVN